MVWNSGWIGESWKREGRERLEVGDRGVGRVAVLGLVRAGNGQTTGESSKKVVILEVGRMKVN